MVRHDSVLPMKVVLAQKIYPTQGDFSKIVENILKDLKVTYEQAITLSKTHLKALLKKNARLKNFNQHS